MPVLSLVEVAVYAPVLVLIVGSLLAILKLNKLPETI